MSHLGHKVSVLPTLSMFVQYYYLIQRWGEKYSLVCSKFSVRGLSGSQVCPRSILLQAIINQHFYFCCYALNQGRKMHWAWSCDWGPMNEQDKEDLVQVENFGFNLWRLCLLHQHVLEFWGTKILSLLGTQRGWFREENRQGEVKQQVIDNIWTRVHG